MIIDFGLPKNCMILSSVNNPQYKIEMSKEEAIQAMKEGKKVTHRFFSSDEWMTIEN